MSTPDDLPTAIRGYLDRPDTKDFTADAVVVDDGHTYRGTAEVHRFLTEAGSEFTVTTTLTGIERHDDEHWTVTNHLSGDFPGGEVDLRFRFTLRDGLISALTIAP